MKTLTYLIFFVILNTAPSWAGTATLSWDPNTESDLAGYRIHYGTASGSYTEIRDVGLVTEHTIDNLTDGQTYYFAVTASDTSNNRSGFSNEVSKLIGTTGGGGGGGGGASPSSGGGGGCGMIRHLSNRPGSTASQAALNLLILALPLILVKIKVRLGRVLSGT